MHSRHALILGLLIVSALAAGWWMSSSKPVIPMAARPPIIPSKPAVPSAAAQPVQAITPPQVLPAPKLAVVEAAPTTAPPTKPVFAPGTPPAAFDARKRYTEELEQVGLMLRDYRTLMKENPVGSNAEIMAALMGGNPKHARLGPPGGAGLNDQGELLDQWGTPYFFHQMSATLMEIHSAGPDKRMWTSDDVVVR
jgi:hypothetical protein